MPDWMVYGNLATAGNEPVRFHDEHGKEVFAYGYIRISGPGDATMPRRVIGTGDTRASAATSAVRALRRHDSTYHVVAGA
jgi:hypothetical protein